MASDADGSQTRLTHTAGRAALFPARTAARVWRDQLETAIDEVLSAPEIARVIDRALAGPLPEEITRSLVRHRVLERVVAELASTGELDRLLAQALASPRTVDVTDQVLASDQMRRTVEEVVASPAVRAAITRQTTGFFEEVADRVSAAAVRLDDRLTLRRWEPSAEPPPPFAGIVTRALALAADALLTIALYMLVVGSVALIGSLVGGLRPHWLVGVLLAVGWAVIAGGPSIVRAPDRSRGFDRGALCRLPADSRRQTPPRARGLPRPDGGRVRPLQTLRRAASRVRIDSPICRRLPDGHRPLRG